MNIPVILVLLFPLAGFLVLGLGYQVIPKKLTAWIGPGTICGSFVMGVMLWIGHESSGNGHQLLVKGDGQQAMNFGLFNWFSSGDLSVSFGFLVDPLSLLMILVVTGVGFIIHVYSVGYMKRDPGFNRFFSYMNLFVFSMLMLVMADNYLVMFIGWEGVGLCSYLLIGFWFRNQEFNDAAKKAFIMNRIGDLGFLTGMFLLFITFGSLNFRDIFPQAAHLVSGDPVIVAITLLLFAGAIGKSAQIPLHTWLPDAMAGPTPVSALIHAATMVTAGVYMVARSGALYVMAPVTLSVIAVTGLVTALVAASVAIYQNDIKKVLAYSTISQLGYMFLALGTGAFTGAMFHLTTHAFFKALLFLGAGSVIHALRGEQDIRKMGGLREKMPVTWYTFLIGTIAIAGLPPLSGFFSKDEILLQAWSSGWLMWLLAFAGSLMTVFYMFRLLNLTFLRKFRGSAGRERHLHESPPVMTIPLRTLALLAALGGVVNLPALFGGSEYLEQFLHPVFTGVQELASRHPQPSVNTEITLLFVTLTGIVIMIFLAYQRFVNERKGLDPDNVRRRFIPRLLAHRYYADELYSAIIIRPALWTGRILGSFLENKVIDATVNGMGHLAVRAAGMFRYLQTGHVGFYLFLMTIGIILIIVLNILI
jgi:NADH-quinone oxidoreductase subunit L